MDRPLPSASRRFTPSVDGLEPRRLTTVTSSSASYSYVNYAAQHDDDAMVGVLRRIELNSEATPAQYLALRDDSRALTEAVSAPGAVGNPTSLQNGVVGATLLIDRSLLEGWQSDEGWAGVESRLTTDLAPFHVTATLIEKTVADMEAAAVSANVDVGSYQVYTADLAAFEAARAQSTWYFHDPQVYYTQHLRGFFRGWAVQRVQDQAALQAEENAVVTPSTAGSATVRRDASLLGRLGDAIPSAANQQLTVAYVNSFSQGAPSPAALAAFRPVAIEALGATASASRIAAVDRLIADAPALFSAVGSTGRVRALVDAVTAVVDDGQGASLNPFKVSILPKTTAGG